MVKQDSSMLKQPHTIHRIPV